MINPPLTAHLATHFWPIRGEFRLSRGARTKVDVLQLTLTGGGHTARAEAVPYARYGETIDGVRQQVETLLPELEQGLTIEALQQRLPAGAARNLCDLALWDWQAKSTGQPVWQLAGLPTPKPLTTAYTLSLASSELMAHAAQQAKAYPVLKLKLGTPDDAARLQAIKAARPDAKLIVDANEGWTMDQLVALAPVMADCGVVLVEQPLPAAADADLAGHKFPFALCADESIHTSADIPALAGRYQAVNIKLDKTGGLTEAIRAVKTARQHNLGIMIGCMLASSLAMAPAVLLAGLAADGPHWTDLDGPLLLADDCKPALEYRGPYLQPPQRDLWG